jgi:hypothetical protein
MELINVYGVFLAPFQTCKPEFHADLRHSERNFSRQGTGKGAFTSFDISLGDFIHFGLLYKAADACNPYSLYVNSFLRKCE